MKNNFVVKRNNVMTFFLSPLKLKKQKKIVIQTQIIIKLKYSQCDSTKKIYIVIILKH